MDKEFEDYKNKVEEMLQLLKPTMVELFHWTTNLGKQFDDLTAQQQFNLSELALFQVMFDRSAGRLMRNWK